eukprot:8719078-Alexandrium_andersonii.AAC.1
METPAQLRPRDCLRHLGGSAAWMSSSTKARRRTFRTSMSNALRHPGRRRRAPARPRVAKSD